MHSNWCVITTLHLGDDNRERALLRRAASANRERRPAMSRHWHRVSKSMQKLAFGRYPVMSEGMFPYEIYYVLGTDEEIQRLNELSTTIGAG